MTEHIWPWLRWKLNVCDAQRDCMEVPGWCKLIQWMRSKPGPFLQTTWYLRTRALWPASWAFQAHLSEPSPKHLLGTEQRCLSLWSLSCSLLQTCDYICLTAICSAKLLFIENCRRRMDEREWENGFNEEHYVILIASHCKIDHVMKRPKVQWPPLAHKLTMKYVGRKPQPEWWSWSIVTEISLPILTPRNV